MKQLIYSLVLISLSHCSNERSFDGHWALEASSNINTQYVEWVINGSNLIVYDDNALIYNGVFSIDENGYVLPEKKSRIKEKSKREMIVTYFGGIVETYRLLDEGMVPATLGDSSYLLRRYMYYLNNELLSKEEKERWTSEYERFIKGMRLKD